MAVSAEFVKLITEVTEFHIPQPNMNGRWTHKQIMKGVSVVSSHTIQSDRHYICLSQRRARVRKQPRHIHHIRFLTFGGTLRRQIRDQNLRVLR
ncbi:unnamed protein product [Trifolium pratense]|uniref:Uncharacterized protein n=1 Tax=Trifolium pratense TaxID=57577 RepID=A0ACB0LJN9_TRIPR|nr:unnamed protein product [Trifolium pratense]